MEFVKFNEEPVEFCLLTPDLSHMFDVSQKRSVPASLMVMTRSMKRKVGPKIRRRRSKSEGESEPTSERSRVKGDVRGSNTSGCQGDWT